MSIFAKIKDVECNRINNYFKDGDFKVRIKTVKLHDSQQAAVKQFFIIEVTVLESSNPQIGVGDVRSEVIDMGIAMSLPNVKTFITAASGVVPNSENGDKRVEEYWTTKLMKEQFLRPGESLLFPDICEYIISDGNPLAGRELYLHCETILTKSEGKEFTKHMWSPHAPGSAHTN